jgi:hypothetical protein
VNGRAGAHTQGAPTDESLPTATRHPHSACITPPLPLPSADTGRTPTVPPTRSCVTRLFLGVLHGPWQEGARGALSSSSTRCCSRWSTRAQSTMRCTRTTRRIEPSREPSLYTLITHRTVQDRCASSCVGLQAHTPSARGCKPRDALRAVAATAASSTTRTFTAVCHRLCSLSLCCRRPRRRIGLEQTPCAVHWWPSSPYPNQGTLHRSWSTMRRCSLRLFCG